MEATPLQTVREIAKGLEVRKAAVTDDLKRSGKVGKLEKWCAPRHE